MTAVDRDWYVLSTQVRKERQAVANLRHQGFETFFPVLSTSVGRPGAKRTEFLPLFPGYIFVRFCKEADRWQAINSTFGVRRLLSAAWELPTPVGKTIMAELFDRCPDGILQTTKARFQPGEQVTVVDGPFAGMPACFEEMLPRDRVRILMTWLNSEISVVMSPTFISAVAA